tara:strand:- start:4825 stop:8844 length:4020 start_codon:yes stop_codon:yes gene_type:complete
MADDYRRHKMDFSFLPSLLSDVGRAKTFVRPTTSEKINTGLGAVFNFVEALEQDRQMEMVDQQKLNRSIQLGNMRSEAQEYKDLKEEYEPFAKQFKANSLDIDDEDAQDAILGQRVWKDVYKANPKFFAAHPNFTYEDFMKRKSLLLPQEDNNFYRVANDLYTGLRSNLAQKIKMSQKFDPKEFNRNYVEAERLIQGLGSNVLKNSNLLSKLTGSDKRRIKLANSLIESKMANMLNAPIIEAEQDYEAWQQSGQKLDLVGTRKVLADSKLSYFNVLPNNALAQFKGIPKALADHNINLMRKSVLRLQKEFNLEANELPPTENIKDAWLINTIGTLSRTDGQKVLHGNLMAEVDVIVKAGGKNVDEQIQVAWESYQKDLVDFVSLPTNEAQQKLNLRRNIRELEAEKNQSPEQKQVISHLKIIEKNNGLPAGVVEMMLAQSKAKSTEEAFLAVENTEFRADNIINNPNIIPSNRKKLLNSGQLYTDPPSIEPNSPTEKALLAKVTNHFSNLLETQFWNSDGMESKSNTLAYAIQQINNEGPNAAETQQLISRHWHTIESIVGSNKHSINLLGKYGKSSQDSFLGGNVDNTDPELLNILAEVLTDTAGLRESDRGLSASEPNRFVYSNKIKQYVTSELKGFVPAGEYMMSNPEKGTSMFAKGTIFDRTPSSSSSVQAINQVIGSANQYIEALKESEQIDKLQNFQTLFNAKFSGLVRDPETGTYETLDEMPTPIEIQGTAIPVEVRMNLSKAAEILDLNVAQGTMAKILQGVGLNPMVRGGNNPRSRMNQQFNPEEQDTRRKLATAITLDKKIQLDSSLLQKERNVFTDGEVKKVKPGGKEAEEIQYRIARNLSDFKRLISDPYVQDVLQEANLTDLSEFNMPVALKDRETKLDVSMLEEIPEEYTSMIKKVYKERHGIEMSNEDLLDSYFTREGRGYRPPRPEELKKKITETDATSNIIDNVFNSLVPNAEAATIEELVTKVTEARTNKRPSRSIEELRNIVLKARKAEELSEEAKKLVEVVNKQPEIKIPTNPSLLDTERKSNPEKELKIAQEFISTISPEEMAEIDRKINEPKDQEKTWLQSFKLNEKEIDTYKKTYNATRQEAIEFLKETHISNMRMLSRQQRYEKENPPQGFDLLLESNAVPTTLEPQLQVVESLLTKAEDMYSGTDVDSAKIIIAMLNSNKIIKGMEKVNTGNKEFIIKDLNRQKDQSVKRIEEGKKIIEEVNNSRELVEYNKKIKTLSPDEKTKEFNRLRNIVAALPFGTTATDKENLIGYKKLAMLFPNKKAGKGGSSISTITEKVNQYSPNIDIGTKPEVFDKAIKFLNSGKFNLNNWIIQE